MTVCLRMKNKSAQKKGEKKEKKREKGKKETNTQTNKKVVFAKKENKARFRRCSTPNLTDSNQSYPLPSQQPSGIGPRPFSLTLHEIDARIDTQYATPCV